MASPYPPTAYARIPKVSNLDVHDGILYTAHLGPVVLTVSGRIQEMSCIAHIYHVI